MYVGVGRDVVAPPAPHRSGPHTPVPHPGQASLLSNGMLCKPQPPKCSSEEHIDFLRFSMYLGVGVDVSEILSVRPHPTHQLPHATPLSVKHASALLGLAWSGMIWDELGCHGSCAARERVSLAFSWVSHGQLRDAGICWSGYGWAMVGP